MKLFYRESGEGKPLIILHGLFGSSDNWHSLSKVFARRYHVFVVDQRNHGQSPHNDAIDYKLLTEDLEDFIEEHNIEDPIIIGHSMGGKTAMNYAIKNPQSLSKLVVVDIAPKSYPVHHDAILKGLASLNLEHIESRSEADSLLSKYVPDPSVRQFLLKNLARDVHQKYEWRINIPVISENIEALGAGLQYDGRFEHPALFIIGYHSEYFEGGDEIKVRKYFSKAEFKTLDTGHWVQAENPKEFTEAVFDFL